MISSMDVSQSHCANKHVAVMRWTVPICAEEEQGTHEVDVEDVDVVRAQLLERRVEGDRHRLDAVPDVVHLLRDVLRAAHHVRRVLPRCGSRIGDISTTAYSTSPSTHPPWSRRPSGPSPRASPSTPQ